MTFSRRTLLQTAFRRGAHPFVSLMPAGIIVLLCGFAAPNKPPNSQAGAQTNGVPAGTPRSWVETAANNELHIIDDDGSVPLRYRVRKIDGHSDTTREEIETRQGDVARLIERNGQPITTSEDAAEKERLNAILRYPSDFIKHHKRDSSMRKDVMQLVSMMPQAMIYSYVPNQPQQPGAKSPQVVIDFKPDPRFKPPTMYADLLTGVEGRMWIDAESHRLTRIEGHVLQPINFGFGLVAHIYPGGTIEFEQANPGGERWVYSHLVEHLSVRAMLVKTIPEDNQMTASDFRLLPAPVSFQDAVHLLLAMQIPLR